MQNASDISFELLGEKESGGGGVALVLLSWKAAVAELCHSADTRQPGDTAAVAGEQDKGLGQRTCLHSRERNNAKMCLHSEKRLWKNSLWSFMWLLSPSGSGSGFLAHK